MDNHKTIKHQRRKQTKQRGKSDWDRCCETKRANLCFPSHTSIKFVNMSPLTPSAFPPFSSLLTLFLSHCMSLHDMSLLLSSFNFSIIENWISEMLRPQISRSLFLSLSSIVCCLLILLCVCYFSFKYLVCVTTCFYFPPFLFLFSSLPGLLAKIAPKNMSRNMSEWSPEERQNGPEWHDQKHVQNCLQTSIV